MSTATAASTTAGAADTTRGISVWRYQVQFHTPAFLGDAEQNGRWRTPPFKAQLRQWWRVAYAAVHDFPDDIGEMRHAEGVLFGHAWLENDRDERAAKVAARKSQVRLRISQWQQGGLQQNQWPRFATVSHPEEPQQVASDLYLGYGPVTMPRGAQRPTLKARAAIQVNDLAEFSLAIPKHASGLITHALWLMDRYGTLGGRSRNGWGSYALQPIDGTPVLSVDPLPLRDWKAALDLDWPHAIGKDGMGALIWQTEPHDDWQSLMKTLATVKIRMRTQKPAFELILNEANHDEELISKTTNERTGISHGCPQDRHWIAYPVTNHKVKTWERYALRLPNQLCFKARKTRGGKLVGVIFHMPHLPPPAFNPNRTAIERVWQQVHAFLDDRAQNLTRIPA